jgi:hypothetical protein
MRMPDEALRPLLDQLASLFEGRMFGDFDIDRSRRKARSGLSQIHK